MEEKEEEREREIDYSRKPSSTIFKNEELVSLLSASLKISLFIIQANYVRILKCYMMAPKKDFASDPTTPSHVYHTTYTE